MAMGKPVVCSNIGEARNILIDGQTGLLANDQPMFISKMKSLILDAGLRQSIGCQARKEIEDHYSLNVLGKELNSILRGLDD
jgi:glycosyltransferase involved in cell wall biosynthesis